VRSGRKTRGRPRWFRFTQRQLWWFGLLACALAILYLAGVHLGPALRAAQGHGVRGRWVATQLVCGRRDGCDWIGEFVLPNGKVQLPRVLYTGRETSVHVGWTRPALNSGGGDEVYPLHGSNRWVHDVIGVIGAGVVIVILAWLSVRARLRRRRQRRAFAGVA
jgi:hypothetical protein